MNNYNSLDKDIIKSYNSARRRKMHKYLCHAPFKSLTFFLAGEILVCWYNKQYKLGQYPEDNIHDIWFGEKAKKIREHIKNNDLSLGCNECKRQFIGGNFRSTGAFQYDRLIEKEKEYPVSLDFQISNTCNLECIMCHGEYSSSIRQNREKKPSYKNQYDSDFVKQLEEFIPHLKRASFTGGEVFLINIYHEIWEKFYQLNPNVLLSITTNGTILGNKEKEILEKLKFNITVSIDSFNKYTYEIIRKNASHEKILNNLDFYVDYTKRKKTKLSARICPMRQNWRELPNLVNYLNDKNVQIYFNTVLFPSYSSLWNMFPAEIMDVIKCFEAQSINTNNRIQKNNKLSFDNLIGQLKKWHKNSVKRESELAKINDYKIEQIIDLLNSRIDEFLDDSDIYDSLEKQDFKEFFERVINVCHDEIINKEQLRNAFVNLLGYPINRLIDEFMIRDVEKLVNFIKQTGLTDQNQLY